MGGVSALRTSWNRPPTRAELDGLLKARSGKYLHPDGISDGDLITQRGIYAFAQRSCMLTLAVHWALWYGLPIFSDMGSMALAEEPENYELPDLSVGDPEADDPLELLSWQDLRAEIYGEPESRVGFPQTQGSE